MLLTTYQVNTHSDLFGHISTISFVRNHSRQLRIVQKANILRVKKEITIVTSEIKLATTIRQWLTVNLNN